MEEWKPLSGYEWHYEISSYGRVRNTATGQIRKLFVHPSGYCLVDLYIGNKKKNFRVHRLVAQAFIDNPFGYEQVNHIDGNKQNNHVENLEWIDAGGNTRHALKIGHFNNKPLIDSNGVIYESAHEAQRQLGIHNSNISKVCRGIYKQYKGMVFKYVS